MHWFAVRSELTKQVTGNAIDQLWIWESAKVQSEPESKETPVETDLAKSDSVIGELKRHRRSGLILTALLVACWVGSSFVLYKEQKREEKAREHSQKGEFFLSIGDLDAAVNEYGKAINYKPMFESYLGRGIAYTRKGEIVLGISDYTEALKLSPNGPDTYKIYFGRARAYDQKESYDYALADYSRSIELEPRNPEAYYYRGRILTHQLKRPSEALISFEAARQLNPKDSDISWELGEALMENDRDLPRALELLQALPDTYKAIPNYQASLGWAVFKNGNSYSATSHLQNAIRMGDYSTKTYERLGDVYRQQGYNTSAIDPWKNALNGTADPDDQKRLRDKIAKASPPILLYPYFQTPFELKLKPKF
jgi:tetratricopeptide (TPR) repeat protein